MAHSYFNAVLTPVVSIQPRCTTITNETFVYVSYNSEPFMVIMVHGAGDLELVSLSCCGLFTAENLNYFA